MPPAVEISLLKKMTARQQSQPQGGRFDAGADRLSWSLNSYIKTSTSLPHIDVMH